MKDLTTTSFVILAHLAVKPFTAYDLAQQFNRGLRLVWSRAESAIYEEPKNLVAQGLARVREEKAGKRSRAVYSITPKGRRALKSWLATPASEPAFESETLLRVFFGETGTKEDLRTSLEQFEAFGRAIRAQISGQIKEYLADGGPFPERLHVISLGSRYLLGHAAWMEEWSRWARERIERWPDASGRAAPLGKPILRESLERFGPIPEEPD